MATLSLGTRNATGLASHQRPYQWLFILLCVGLTGALLYPLFTVFIQSVTHQGAFTLQYWATLLTQSKFWTLVGHSFWVAGLSAFIASSLAFLAAYGLTFTHLPPLLKRAMHVVLLLPLFLPSITYGFAVIYSFGRMGLITQLIGPLPFSIYGFWGLLIADVVYTLPAAFLVLYNAFRYVDRRYTIVSRVMGDGFWRSFWQTALRPTLGAYCAAFVLSFFLAFTDFGIPVSIAGQYDVIASELYATMMGAIPNFGQGAVIAIAMLVPSMVAVYILKKTDRLNFRYHQLSDTPAQPNRARDAFFTLFFIALSALLLAIFAVIFIVPFVKYWPYQPDFTWEHVVQTLTADDTVTLYVRSLGIAFLTAVLGTAVAFSAALIRARSTLAPWCRSTMDGFAMITSTLPGMVLGVGYLFAFSGTSLQNTLTIIVLANIVHFLATPYFMATHALSKMNAHWETTAILMGDSWLKSVLRIVIPNAKTTLIQMFETFFMNAMVTISALVFLTSTQTMVLTTRMKELQYFERFDAIFVLSLLIFVTNVVVKLALDAWIERRGGHIH